MTQKHKLPALQQSYRPGENSAGRLAIIDAIDKRFFPAIVSTPRQVRRLQYIVRRQRWLHSNETDTVSKAEGRPSCRQKCFNNFPVSVKITTSGARFTKYLTTILRLSYDNARLTINLRRRLLCKTSDEERKAWVQFTCNIARSSKIVFVNQLTTFLKEVLARFKSLS